MSDKLNDKRKKKAISITLTTDNYALLKWLKMNFNDHSSTVINTCLDKYRLEFTRGMTEYEKNQIEQLQVIVEGGIFDKKEIEQMKIKALENLKILEVNSMLEDPAKRKKLKELIEMY